MTAAPLARRLRHPSLAHISATMAKCGTNEFQVHSTARKAPHTSTRKDARWIPCTQFLVGEHVPVRRFPRGVRSMVRGRAKAGHLAAEASERLLSAGRLLSRAPTTPEGRAVSRADQTVNDAPYRERRAHDKVVRSTHGVNCTGSCQHRAPQALPHPHRPPALLPRPRVDRRVHVQERLVNVPKSEATGSPRRRGSPSCPPRSGPWPGPRRQPGRRSPHAVCTPGEDGREATRASARSPGTAGPRRPAGPPGRPGTGPAWRRCCGCACAPRRR